MRTLKRLYQPATLQRNLTKLFTCKYLTTYSVLNILHRRMHMSDDNGRLSKTVSSQRSVQTDNKSEGEAWEAMVDYSKLSDIEIKIHQKHVAANRVSGLKFYLYTFQSHTRPNMKPQ